MILPPSSEDEEYPSGAGGPDPVLMREGHILLLTRCHSPDSPQQFAGKKRYERRQKIQVELTSQVFWRDEM